jgi:TRAP transporter TAXI family solute receptor
MAYINFSIFTSQINKKFRRIIIFLLVVVNFLVTGCITQTPKNTKNHKDNITVIGTGITKGTNYHLGDQICKIINQKKDRNGLYCDFESTRGNIANMDGIIASRFDFGMVRSDFLYEVYNGLGRRGEPKKELRAVFQIYPDTVILVASGSAGIHTIEDLKSKTVGVGHPESPETLTSVFALFSAGLNYESDLEARYIRNPSERHKQFRSGKLDALLFTTGHPSGILRRDISCKKNVLIIPITNVIGLIEKFPYFTRTKIPIGFYPKAINTKDVETIGLWTTLVTSINVPDDVVYAFTKEIFKNLDELKKPEPALHLTTRENMVENLKIPLHPGALRYYKEVGLK